MTNPIMRIEFRASSDFVDRLEDLSASMKVSKAEVIRAAIDTLEMVAAADREGKGIAFVPKKEQRYGILVDDKFVEALTALAKRTGKNKEDVIRDALNYYENSLNEWDEVNSLPPGATSHD